MDQIPTNTLQERTAAEKFVFAQTISARAGNCRASSRTPAFIADEEHGKL